MSIHMSRRLVLAVLFIIVAISPGVLLASGRVIAVSGRIEYKGEVVETGVLQMALSNALTTSGHRVELLGEEAWNRSATELVKLLRQGSGAPSWLRNARDADLLLVAKGDILEGRELPYGRGQISVHAVLSGELFDIKSGLMVCSCPQPARAMDADNFESQAVRKAVARVGKDVGTVLADYLASVDKRVAVVDPCPDLSDESDVAWDIPETGTVNRNAWAVVIGNRDYEHEDIQPVEFAHADACLMARYFEKALGVPPDQIISRYNVDLSKLNLLFGTRHERTGQLARFVDAGKTDLYVYYSGHGAPYPAGSTLR